MWQLLAKNPASGKVATNLVDMVNATNFPAKVGVWVSGRCQWADIERVDLVTDNYDFSDIVCSYTAQPGDFGLLTLAAGTEAQPVEAATEGTGAYSYLLKNSRYWGFFDAMTKTNACNLWLTSLQESDVSAYVTFPADDTPRWVQDRDMSQAGIYIKTIDFDDSKFNDDVWRRIAAGGTSAYVSNGNAKRAPALSIPGAVATDHTVTLYAWAEDESVAYLKNGVEKDFVTNGVTVTRHVAHITIEPADGEIKEIPGGILAKEDATNKTTRIFLSATPTNIFRSGVLVTNFVTKTVLVGAPEPPSIVVTINDQSDYTAVAGSPDDYDPVLPITIGFEGVESYTSPIDVTVTAEMINSAADTVEFVGLSRTNSNDPNSYGASATVTIPANSSSAFIYAYVKRASSETSDATKGISLKATVTDPAAISYFAGGIHAGTLHIQAAKPKITAPATDTVYDDVPAGEEYEMSFNVSDAYGELSGHYTLEYTLTGIWSSMNTKTLDLGVPSGSDNTLTTNLIFNTTSSNILVRVRNQDDHVSDPIHLTVNVFSKPLINATPYDHVGSDDNPSRTYDEGDIAKLTFTLDTPFALADAGYLQGRQIRPGQVIFHRPQQHLKGRRGGQAAARQHAGCHAGIEADRLKPPLLKSGRRPSDQGSSAPGLFKLGLQPVQAEFAHGIAFGQQTHLPVRPGPDRRNGLQIHRRCQHHPALMIRVVPAEFRTSRGRKKKLRLFSEYRLKLSFQILIHKRSLLLSSVISLSLPQPPRRVKQLPSRSRRPLSTK